MERYYLRQNVWRCICRNINRGDGDCPACEYFMLPFVEENQKEQYFEEKECPECGLINVIEAELCAGCANELPGNQRKSREATRTAPDVWQCQHCTYENPITERICEACGKTRDLLVDTFQEIKEGTDVKYGSEEESIIYRRQSPQRCDTNSNNQKEQRETWTCHCGNVNLIGKDCFACCETKTQQAKEVETPRNTCTRETEVPVPAPEVWQCKHCTYLNPITDRICEACAKTKDVLLEDMAQENQNGTKEVAYKTCKNCEKLVKTSDDMCYRCRCGVLVPDYIHAKQEQKQASIEIGPNEKKLGMIQKVKYLFGLEKPQKGTGEERPCQNCTYENSQNADICVMCEALIPKTAPEETSLKPPHIISISKDVSISGEDFAKHLKAGEEFGFQQGQVIWALRNCGAENPIRYLIRWRENRQRENEAQAAKATAYQHQNPPATVIYTAGGPIFFYPKDSELMPQESDL